MVIYRIICFSLALFDNYIENVKLSLRHVYLNILHIKSGTLHGIKHLERENLYLYIAL